MIEEVGEKPVLVFCNFKHDYQILMQVFKRLKPKKLDISKDIADWNKRKIKMFLAHPPSIGHGLNLQAGGNIISKKLKMN